MAGKPLSADEIRNRVKEVRKVRFGDVAPNPRNPRKHPDNQREAFRGAVREIGFASVPVAYINYAGVLTWADGHLRGSEVADYVGDVAILDITDAEADMLLVTADPIAYLAQTDAAALEALLRDVQTSDIALQQMLADMATEAGIIPPDNPYEHWQGMPEFEQEDKTAFQSIHIHFRTEANRDAFSALIGQNLTNSTRSIWYPFAEKTDMVSELYLDQDES